MEYDFLDKRIEILNKLGGISRPAIHKNEWTDLLTDEAVNSVMIEGFYVSQKQAAAALVDKEPTRSENVLRAVSYHKAALTYYEQAYRDMLNRSFGLSFDDFRKINGMMLVEENLYPGLRRENLQAPGGADCPDFLDLPLLLDMYMEFVRSFVDSFRTDKINIKEFIGFLAKQHCYFEVVHPFEDGNGRTGRILTNYALIACGIPIIAIKGDESAKDGYFSAIKEFRDQMGLTLTLPQSYHNIPDKLNEIETEKMSDIFAELLFESIDMYICSVLEKDKGYILKPLNSIIGEGSYFGIKRQSGRHNYISVKRGRELYSHEDFALRDGKL